MSALQSSSVFIAANELHNCLFVITSDGHSSLLASLMTSSHWPCCGSHLRPFITTLNEPPSDSQRSPSVILNHGASRVDDIGDSQLLTYYATITVTFWGFVMEICKATASQIAILEDGHNPLFAIRINIKGFLLFPISPNLYCGLVLQELECMDLTLSSEVSFPW